MRPDLRGDEAQGEVGRTDCASGGRGGPWYATPGPSLRQPEPAAGAGSFGRLVEGVLRFREAVHPGRQEQFRQLASGQSPHTLFLTCADSRIVPEMITQTDPGELFVGRSIGNLVPAHGELASGMSAIVEYACSALEVSHVVVCGHSDCGAMKALLSAGDPQLARMPAVAAWLRTAEAARDVVEARQPQLSGIDRLRAVTEQNVRTQLLHLRTHPAVAARLATGRLSLHGWVYDIGEGRVDTVEDIAAEAAPRARALAAKSGQIR